MNDDPNDRPGRDESTRAQATVQGGANDDVLGDVQPGLPPGRPRERESLVGVLHRAGVSPRLVTALIWAVLVALSLYALRAGATLLKPLTVSVLLFLLFRPMVVGLRRSLRVPAAVSGALVVAMLLFGFGYGATMLAGPAQSWMRRAPRALKTLDRRVSQLRKPVEGVSAVASALDRLTELETKKAPREVVVATPMTSEVLLEGAGTFVGGVAFSLLALYFLLVFGDSLAQSLVQQLLELRSRQRAARVIEKTCARTARYLGTISLVNLVLGCGIGWAMFALDMPNPALWGAMACLLNFMPYIGAIAGTFVIAVVSLLTFEDVQALWPPLAYLGLTSLEGQLITPLVLANTFRVNPLVLLVWLAFWAWLWGVIGALIAVPLLMSAIALAEEDPRLRPLLTMLGRTRGGGGSTAPDPLPP